MRKGFVVVVWICLVAVSLHVPAKPSLIEDRPDYRPREIIICFRPGVLAPSKGAFSSSVSRPQNAVMAELSRTGPVKLEHVTPALPTPANRSASLQRLKPTGAPTSLEEVAAIFSDYAQDRTVILHLDKDLDVPRLASRLMQRYPDLVEFAEPSYIYTFERIPNDPGFTAQWNLAKIKAQIAWDTTTGDSGVVIGLIDSGMSSQPDLVDKQFINPDEIPGNGIDDDGDGFVDDVSGWNFYAGNNNTSDEFGHGTYVSGVAAAATDNSRAIAGLSWNSPILPLKVTGAGGSISGSDIIRAINYATMMSIHGVRIINMSFGRVGGRSLSELNAIRAAGEAHILCVTSAGNGGGDFVGDNNDLKQHYPSGYEVETDNVIGVAASDRNDRLASFANFGLSVGVAAPGQEILTTANGANDTIVVDGSSLAAPHVAGIAALIYSEFPGSTPFQVRGRIEANVDRPSPNPFREKLLSEGRVNASAVFEQDTMPPDPITDLHIDVIQPLTLIWTATGDDGQQGNASLYDIRLLDGPITPDKFRFTTKVLTALRPDSPGTQQSLKLPDTFPAGTSYVVIQILDNAGNVAESNQITVVKN
jgi:subtilisin family serine protease